MGRTAAAMPQGYNAAQDSLAKQRQVWTDVANSRKLAAVPAMAWLRQHPYQPTPQAAVPQTPSASDISNSGPTGKPQTFTQLKPPNISNQGY